MPLMDEFREEREQIKKAPFPQKVQYFKDYYLLPTIFIVFRFSGTRNPSASR